MEDKIKVIVAEDIDILREDFCEMIRETPDMELVASASSGAETVRIAFENDFDVIVADIEMEGYKDGIKAAQEIAFAKPSARIVFLTIHDEDEMIFEAFSTLVTVDYIMKTSSHSEIVQCIRNAYAGESTINPYVASRLRNEFSRLKYNEQNLLNFMQLILQTTPAERELIRLLIKDSKVAQIARIRNVEVVTVKTQINSLLKKFKVSRSKEITTIIKKLGLEHLFV